MLSGFHTAFLMAAASLLVACTSGEPPVPAASSTTVPTETATATLSTSPAASSPLGPVHSVELPRDDNGYWFPMDLLQGTTTFVVEYGSDADRETAPPPVTRLAFFDPDTGALDEFRTLNPGDKAMPVANDGRFLVWAECGGGDALGTGWKMYALDTTTRDIWQADSDPGIQEVNSLGKPDCAPTIAVNDGRLVYFALARDDAGAAVYKTVLVNLQTRARTVLAENGDAESQGLFDPSLSGNMLVWTKILLGQGPTSAGQYIRELHLADLSSGEDRVIAQGIIGRWSTIRDGKVLYSTLPSPPDFVASMHLVDVSTGEDRTLTPTEPSPGCPTLVGDLALWDQGVPTVYDTKSGRLVMLSKPYSALLFAANQRIYWEWNQPRNGQATEKVHFFLQWVDLPSP